MGWLLASGLLVQTLAPAALGADAGAGLARVGGLLGRRWAWDSFTATDADAGGTTLPSRPERYWVEFLPKGKLALQVDCNRGFGTWTQESGGGVQLQPLGTTLMACQGESLDFLDFLELLRQTSSVSRDGASLLLSGPSGVLRLAEVQADARLTETSWTLVAVEDKTGATPVPAGRYSVEFRPRGALQWTADCAQGGGSWHASKRRALSVHAASGALTTACVPGTPDLDFSRLLNETARFSFADTGLLLEGAHGRLRFSSALSPL
jgi:heat shock protein HslJ